MKIESYSINLSEQMAVCDANYIRILRLLAGTPLLSRKEIMLPSLGGGNSGGGAQTHVLIEVVETFKYTSTVKISQKQNNQNVQYDTPVMLIRMYHDANTAEVTSYQGHKNFKTRYLSPNKHMYQADEKEQLNLFLGQWLRLCQKEGLQPVENLLSQYSSCLDEV